LNLKQFFDENFKEGKRFDLTIRLAGSCAKLGIPIESCIDFYKEYFHLDDEDRTPLIERTYERVSKGLPVKTLAEYNINVASYFGIDVNQYKHIPTLEELENLLFSINQNNQSQVIDLSKVSVPLDKTKHLIYYNYLKSRNLTDEDIEKYDIRVGIGKYQFRIIFPIYNEQNQPIYFVARSILKNIKPKYLNSPVPKERVVWNINNVNFNYPVVVCEGIINAITVMKYLNNGMQAVATLGKQLTEYQKKILSQFPKLIFCFDGDVSESELRKIIKGINTTIYYVKLPDKKDANDLDKVQFLYYFNNHKFKLYDKNPLDRKMYIFNKYLQKIQEAV